VKTLVDRAVASDETRLNIDPDLAGARTQPLARVGTPHVAERQPHRRSGHVAAVRILISRGSRAPAP